MKAFRRLVAIVSAAIVTHAVAGCASNSDVSVLKPIESKTLSQTTFAWDQRDIMQMVPKEFGGGRAIALSEAIVMALSDRGYVMVPSRSEADLIVAVNVDGDLNADLDPSRKSSTITAAPVPSTPYYRRTPAGRRQDAADRVNAAVDARRADMLLGAEIERTVIIDIRDGATGNDLWRGQIRTTIELSELRDSDDEIGEDVAELFEDFPLSDGR